MNEDLERDLAVCEDDLHALVASLQAAPAAQVPADFTARVMAAVQAEQVVARRLWRPRRMFTRLLPWAAAACLAVGVGLACVETMRRTDATARLVACQRADGFFSASSAAPYLQAFAVVALAREPDRHAAALEAAVQALLRGQTAEGGWGNEELTARNVAALQAATAAGVPAAARAYKRGVRYLHRQGCAELSRADFIRAAREACARIAPADRDLLPGAILCARLSS